MNATEPVTVASTDTEDARVRVTTVDAVGTERAYEVGIAPNQKVDGAYVMHGRRVDSDAPDEAAGGGVSSRAWDIAAEHFQSEGYDIWNRGGNE